MEKGEGSCESLPYVFEQTFYKEWALGQPHTIAGFNSHKMTMNLGSEIREDSICNMDHTEYKLGRHLLQEKHYLC